MKKRNISLPQNQIFLLKIQPKGVKKAGTEAAHI
jgi:hypothetical protein